MNRLAGESSPYLQQHAHNPVAWYPWGDDAFEEAVRADKPILLSIGYATCHWCHVMERESFEDEETADLMNRLFVCIKLDREEYPELDKLYMEAVQMLHGHGGWPLNCFLLPDKRPFYGGTYYPAVPGYGRPSWKQVLVNIAGAYRTKKEQVADQAARLAGLIAGASDKFIHPVGPDMTAGIFSVEEEADFMQKLEDQFDTVHGGFGGAPKFPSTDALKYLLLHSYYSGDQRAARHCFFTLDRMLLGGIYDQAGGGFARYTVDEAWSVPHFEKMLYDNALLLEILADAYASGGQPAYFRSARDILAFLRDELFNAESGLYYSALDADSEGSEGRFYVWSYEEFTALAGQDKDLFCDFFGVEPEGNWEETNILRRPAFEEEYARTQGLDETDFGRRVSEFRRRLMEARARRQRPITDDKHILSWNALLVPAFLKWHMYTGDTDFLQVGLDLWESIDQVFAGPANSYARVAMGASARLAANLDDYAYLIRAGLVVYRATLDSSHLDKVAGLAEFAIDHFLDPADGLFFYTLPGDDNVFARRKEVFDAGLSNAQAIMAANLRELGLLRSRPEWGRAAERMLLAIGPALMKYPSALAGWACSALMTGRSLFEIWSGGVAGSKVLTDVKMHYLPNVIINPAVIHYVTGVSGQVADDAGIWICSEFACELPVKTTEELIVRIKERR